jgi:3'(2'), 5'-bisphosphate nucleotidase
MDLQEIKDLTLSSIRVSIEAGSKMLEVYNSDFAVEHKDDKSPLTLADKNSHDAIVAVLDPIGYPVLSEEGEHLDYSQRKEWNNYWIVDPLDGTKEFVKRNGEFTTNIALMEDFSALAGVIYVPVKKTMYFGIVGVGAYKMLWDNNDADSLEELINKAQKLPITNLDRPYTVVGSRSHMSPETEEFIEEIKKEHGEIEIVSMGSSLKICLVAEGVADIYPRFAPTMEWDTAAGQAIVEAAGKEIVNRDTNTKMPYNKENLLNDWFIVR